MADRSADLNVPDPVRDTRRERRSRALLIGAVAGAGVLALAAGAAARRRGGQARAVTYPPLDAPKRVADGIWIVDSGPITAGGLALPVRMTVIRLADGSLLLHSPTRYTPALAEALAPLGRVRHLIAPTTAHWTFLSDWQRAFPDATTWGVPGLRARAAVRRAGVRIDLDLGPTAPLTWAGEIGQGLVPGGGGFCEAYLFHRASGTLLLADLVENLDATRLAPLTALLMRAAGATRGRTALHVRAVLKLGGAPARAAIAEMVALAPERVIFAHGDWFDADGAARLRDAFAWLLGRGRAR